MNIPEILYTLYKTKQISKKEFDQYSLLSVNKLYRVLYLKGLITSYEYDVFLDQDEDHLKFVSVPNEETQKRPIETPYYSHGNESSSANYLAQPQPITHSLFDAADLRLDEDRPYNSAFDLSREKDLDINQTEQQNENEHNNVLLQNESVQPSQTLEQEIKQEQELNEDEAKKVHSIFSSLIQEEDEEESVPEQVTFHDKEIFTEEQNPFESMDPEEAFLGGLDFSADLDEEDIALMERRQQKERENEEEAQRYQDEQAAYFREYDHDPYEIENHEHSFDSNYFNTNEDDE